MVAFDYVILTANRPGLPMEAPEGLEGRDLHAEVQAMCAQFHLLRYPVARLMGLVKIGIPSYTLSHQSRILFEQAYARDFMRLPCKWILLGLQSC